MNLLRRLFRFRLRTLLVLMSLVCVALAVLARPMLDARRQAAAVRQIEEAGGGVYFVRDQGPTGTRDWLVRKCLGEAACRQVAEVTGGNQGNSAAVDYSRLIAGIAKLRSPRGVGFWDASLTADDANKLSMVTGMEHLALFRVQQTPRVLQAFEGSTHLRAVTLCGDSCDDSALAGLKGIPRLERLVIIKPRITAGGIAKLAGCRGLRTLHLSRRPGLLGDAGALPLASWPKLDELMLLDVGACDASLRPINRAPNLRKLIVKQRTPTITDDGLAGLGELQKLERVVLRNTLVGDGTARGLARLPLVTQIALSDCRLTDAGLRLLAGCSTLEKLDAVGTIVTHEGIQTLADWPSLREVQVDLGAGVTKAGLAKLSERRPRLKIIGFAVEPGGVRLSDFMR